ncbi:MAG: hypothetical protein AAGF55_01280 [Pseudomonadota bacterium]
MFSQKYLQLVEVTQQGDGPSRLVDDDEIYIGTSGDCHLSLRGRGLLPEHAIVRRDGNKIMVEDISNGLTRVRSKKSKDFKDLDGETALAAGDFLLLSRETYVQLRTSKVPVPSGKSGGDFLSKVTSGNNALFLGVPLYGLIVYLIFAEGPEAPEEVAMSQSAILELASSVRQCANSQKSAAITSSRQLDSRLDASWRALVATDTPSDLFDAAEKKLIAELSAGITQSQRMMHWEDWEDALRAFEHMREMAPFAPSVIVEGEVIDCKIAAYLADQLADARLGLAEVEGR